MLGDLHDFSIKLTEFPTELSFIENNLKHVYEILIINTFYLKISYISEWCCSVTMVWVQIPSREEQKFDSSKI